jgi:hypothetical protein
MKIINEGFADGLHVHFITVEVRIIGGRAIWRLLTTELPPTVTLTQIGSTGKLNVRLGYAYYKRDHGMNSLE